METVDLGETADTASTLIEMTGGHGPDSVIDAVGMEGHGTPRTTTTVSQRAGGPRSGRADRSQPGNWPAEKPGAATGDP